MKKFRWQILILCIAGLIVGTLLLLERKGGLFSSFSLQPARGGVYTEALIGSLQRLNPLIDSGNSVDQDVDRLSLREDQLRVVRILRERLEG